MSTKLATQSTANPNATLDTVYSYTTSFPDYGIITMYSDGENLIGLSLPSQQYRLDTDSNEIIDKKLPIFKTTEKCHPSVSSVHRFVKKFGRPS